MNKNSQFVILVGIALGLFAFALLIMMSNANSPNILNALFCMGLAIAGGLALVAAAIAANGAASSHDIQSKRENENSPR